MKIQQIDNNPLVSIIVITYNSANFVLETLESAKAQTYQNIELIVSDDKSTDDSVELCRTWLSENKERFVRTDLITANRNTGVTVNANRGFKAATGKWLKFVAGDDTLTKNSISSYVEFYFNNPSSKFIVSDINIIDENSKFIRNRTHRLDKFSFNSNTLLRNILKSCFVSAPGIFIEKELLASIGGFDERFEMQEDYPLFLKLAQIDIPFYYLNQYLVNYRQNNHSIWNQYKAKVISNTALRHFNSTKLFYNLELLPALKKHRMWYSFFRAKLYINKEEKRINHKFIYHFYSLMYNLNINYLLGLAINFTKLLLGEKIYNKYKDLFLIKFSKI